ncbi:MAG: homoserine kinase [Candidatus Nanopelagicales bacterium]
MTLRAGPVTVEVPATSANLGPGFDSLGLALELRDRYTAEAVPAGGPGVADAVPEVRVEVAGEGAGGGVGQGADNLVARAFAAALVHLGEQEPAELRLRCQNTIPHGRGLGSSSAAVVGGIALARALSDRGGRLDDAAVIALASEFEGHPDNAAPAVLGGATIAWTADGVGRAVRFGVDPAVVALLAVPATALATSTARGLLPDAVPMGDAVFNVARAALLVHALGRAPELLVPGTADRLHQDRREQAYPHSHALVAGLRAAGCAAAISGAGPSVIVLGPADAAERAADTAAALVSDGWSIRRIEVAAQGVRTLAP